MFTELLLLLSEDVVIAKVWLGYRSPAWTFSSNYPPCVSASIS